MRLTFIPLVVLLFVLTASSASATNCEFRLGFKTLRDLIGHDIVGECLENEHYNAIGDSNQQTTGGLMAWRKADNWTAFTDGYRTWVNGPFGVQNRLNVQRFYWEADYIHFAPVKVAETVCFGAAEREYASEVRRIAGELKVEYGAYNLSYKKGKGDAPWEDESWIGVLEVHQREIQSLTLELMALEPDTLPAQMFHAPAVAYARHRLTALMLWNRTLKEGVWGREFTESDTDLMNRYDYHTKMTRVFDDAVPSIQCGGRPSNVEELIKQWLEEESAN